MGEIKSSAHSKWRCEYHIVFAPKYRRKEIYGKLKADIGEILRKMCAEKKVDINRSNGVCRPCTHAGKYPTAHKCGTVHGVSQGGKARL